MDHQGCHLKHFDELSPVHAALRPQHLHRPGPVQAAARQHLSRPRSFHRHQPDRPPDRHLRAGALALSDPVRAVAPDRGVAGRAAVPGLVEASPTSHAPTNKIIQFLIGGQAPNCCKTIVDCDLGWA